ncbi:conserved protein, unknown function [Hepatocystis sp. ex Piliocolobus tephrosceles]|nr:conserved protein, unknown function [Hepatocystis sp. ex Piliocolobus tephrosceles]
MKVVLSVSIILLSAFCKGHYHSMSGRNNMVQYLRSGSFMENQNLDASPNNIYSEDINEFDDYETDDAYLISNESSKKRKEQIMDNTTENKNKNKLVFKNIENELNTTQVYNDKNNLNSLGSGARECVVDEKGILNISIHSNDIFNLTTLMVELTANNILIKDTKKLNVIKELPYNSIKLPIETIEETRECWKIKSKKEKILFCAKKKEERDLWIRNILKALFCYNTNNLIIENRKTNTNTVVDIPKKSTVDERIVKAKMGDNTSDDNKPKYVKKTNNNIIEISDLKSSQPNISID